MGHTTLTMTNHYASLSIEQLQKSHEKFSPLRAEKGSSEEVFGEGYWNE
jgi:integrase/recombinase XerD